MPINEIHAPFYIRSKIATPAYPDGHGFRLYLASGATLVPGSTGDEDDWRIMNGSVDCGSVASVLHELLTRAGTNLPAGSSVAEIELWQSIPNAPNNLLHLNTLPLGNSYGSGSGIAAAYGMIVFAGALRDQFRMTFFDGGDAKPQKYPPTTPPAADNGSLVWYVLRGLSPFATNDGIRLTRMVSANTGYNRRLARSYGRTIAP